MRHTLIRSAIIAVGVLLSLAQQNAPLISAAHAACDPGTRLDKTTAEEIRGRLVKAGYENPSHLRKGCDNSWHGTAMKGGQQLNIAVTADGHIVEEGD
ncbi:MAG TPA: hypothetical protein VGF92_09405 [Stellaceae bacterium]|jgi:hypothetical protein